MTPSADELAIRPCKMGHMDRYPTGRCRPCAIDRAARWAAANPERFAANQTNRDKVKEVEGRRQRYAQNREAIKAKTAAWSRTNPDARRAAVQRWRNKNKDWVALQNAKRRAAVVAATPTWADEAEIASVYRRARELTEETGEVHSVDHIVPLRGRNVCGLHVQDNLRVITWSENARKGNRHDVG